MKCPKCGSSNTKVHCHRQLSTGYTIRYMCRSCKRTFTEDPKTGGRLPKSGLDTKDLKIIECLRENVRASYKSIAKKVGLSDVAVYNRVINMLDLEFIRFDVVILTDKIVEDEVEEKVSKEVVLPKVESKNAEVLIDDFSKSFGFIKVE